MITETYRLKILQFEDDLDYSGYCNSVIECTDSDGNLSELDTLKLLKEHDASYYDYVADCGHDYHANTVLTWLGY